MTIRESLGWLRRTRAAKTVVGSPSADSAGAAGLANPVRETATDHCREAEASLARGEIEAALMIFQRVIDQVDGSAAGHLGQARAYVALDRIEDAADSLQVALAIEPAAIDALILLARIRRDAGATDEARELLERARSYAPANVEILTDLASVFNRCGRTDEAIDVYRQAIQVAPQDPRPRVNLGLLYLVQLGNPAVAESNFRSALAVTPGQIEASANLGLALHDQGRYEEAFEHYRQALTVHPESIELRWNRGLANLSAGNLRAGWEDYELRFSRRGGRNLARFTYREWDGSPLPDARLLVLAEQGLGDEIMFVSCVPELIAQAKGVILESAPRLARLFARSFPQVEVHGRERHAPLEWLQRYPDIGAKVPMGSLPKQLRRDPTDFPRHNGYLCADATRTENYRRQLADCRADTPVGLSWRGGTSATRSELRSVNLAALQPLLAVERFRFVCLQHQLTAEERKLAREMGMTLWEEALSDIDELAALISALDRVVTVDNLNLHLAGALGRPTWGMLGASPDWRWLRQGSSSPWYPSVELLRVSDFGGWTNMIENVAAQLQSNQRDERHFTNSTREGRAK